MDKIDVAVQARLSKGIELMNIALQMSTGLTETNRKLVIYWTIATHMLPNIDTFPLLVLRGPLQTGKSQTLKIVACFAHNPRKFTVGSSSFAVIRDEFAQSYEGTAIIEEADAAKDGSLQLERFLSDRYQRDSANIIIKQKHGRDSWESVNQKLFGATALHRRVAFSDAALDGRSVSILFRNVKRNDYIDSGTVDWIRDGYTNVPDLTFKPIEIDRPNNVSDRIFNSYKPLLMCANIFGDFAFQDDIQEKLEIETDAVREAQSFEPDGLVVRAILALVNSSASYNSIKFASIATWIWDNHRATLQPRQIGGLVRSMGFTTKESHGTTVMIPSPARLLKACHDCGYDNEEEITELKQHVTAARVGWWSGVV